jgi:hypothetical protein
MVLAQNKLQSSYRPIRHNGCSGCSGDHRMNNLQFAGRYHSVCR